MEDSERVMELEALSAIFVEGEELQIISGNEIVLLCDPHRQDGSTMCSMQLKFTLPDGYPAEESLQYEIIDDVGLDEEARDRIAALIEEVIERNQGMPMVYPIVEAVNQELEQLPLSSDTDPQGEQVEGGETEVNEEAYDGGPQLKQLCKEQDRVTEEEFQKWSKQFRSEMIAKGIWRDIDAGRQAGQMTGREIFETKSANLDYQETDSVFWNNESLYEGDYDEVEL